MLRLKNPFFVSADAVTVAQLQSKVEVYLKSVPDKDEVTLAEIRAALPAEAALMSRRVVAQIVANLGGQVVDPKATDI